MRFMSYHERASAGRSLFNITEKYQYERPGPARPETLLRSLYLSNHLTDLHTVIVCKSTTIHDAYITR